MLAPHRERFSWDAPIHSIADIEALPYPPRMVNIKPSRLGGLRNLLDAYDYCAERGIGNYGGGQFELGVGRGQIQYLASLFHADAPNDVAPTGFNLPEPPAGLPASPLAPAPRAARLPLGLSASARARIGARAQLPCRRAVWRLIAANVEGRRSGRNSWPVLGQGCLARRQCQGSWRAQARRKRRMSLALVLRCCACARRRERRRGAAPRARPAAARQRGGSRRARARHDGELSLHVTSVRITRVSCVPTAALQREPAPGLHARHAADRRASAWRRAWSSAFPHIPGRPHQQRLAGRAPARSTERAAWS